MAVRTERNALLDLFPRFGVRTLLGQLVDRLLTCVANDVVKVNDGRMREPAMRTILRRLKLHPGLSAIPAVLVYGLLVLFLVFKVPAFICQAIFELANFRILVRHLGQLLSPVKGLAISPWLTWIEQLVPAFNQTVRAGRVIGRVRDNPFKFIAPGIALPERNHAFLQSFAAMRRNNPGPGQVRRIEPAFRWCDNAERNRAITFKSDPPNRARRAVRFIVRQAKFLQAQQHGLAIGSKFNLFEVNHNHKIQ